jgi:hypothetical protein
VDPEDQWVPKLAYRMSIEGNRDPIDVTRLPDKSLDVVAGFNRHAAGMLIVNGFDYTDEDGKVIHVHEPDFKLKVNLVPKGNNIDRLKYNKGENLDREPMTAMDYAGLIKYARDVCGMTSKQIATEIIGYDQSVVSQYAKLLECPSDIQERLARVPAKNAPNKLSWRVCAKITELSESLQEEFYGMIREGKKVTLELIKFRLADATEDMDTDDDNEDDNSPFDENGDEGDNGDSGDEGDEGETNGSSGSGKGGGKGKGKGKGKKEGEGNGTNPRMQVSTKMVRKWAENMISPGEFVAVREFCTTLTKKFLTGEKTGEKELERILYKLVRDSQKTMFVFLKENGLLNDEADFESLHKLVRANQTSIPARNGK